MAAIVEHHAQHIGMLAHFTLADVELAHPGLIGPRQSSGRQAQSE